MAGVWSFIWWDTTHRGEDGQKPKSQAFLFGLTPQVGEKYFLGVYRNTKHKRSSLAIFLYLFTLRHKKIEETKHILVKYSQNIATGETSEAIAPHHFFYSNFFDFYH